MDEKLLRMEGKGKENLIISPTPFLAISAFL
jgi:hypothetical protein